MRSQRQPEPSGDLAGGAEEARVRHVRRDHAGGDGANAGHGGEPAAGGVGSMPVQDPALEVIHLLRQAFGVVDQGADCGNSVVRQAVSGGAKLGF